MTFPRRQHHTFVHLSEQNILHKPSFRGFTPRDQALCEQETLKTTRAARVQQLIHSEDYPRLGRSFPSTRMLRAMLPQIR